MAHSRHVIASPHPDNAERTHTIALNTDCPRCGGSLAGLGVEPDDLFHCPHCRGGLDACARIEDGGADRTTNIVTIAWIQPASVRRRAGDDCVCVGCASTRPRDGVAS
jgi:hypothetical protein